MIAAAALAASMVLAWGATPAGADPAGLTVTDLNSGATANGMATSLAGSGVSVSNVTYTGNNRGGGMFTSGDSSIIGFDSGIVLDSGNVETQAGDPTCGKGVEGPNTCYETNPSGSSDNSTDLGAPGDSDLDTLSGFTTFDASVLQFDFVPQFSTVQFKYVFSSEEYSDYSNSQYNDVFGFFVNGTNCALVPGTTDPVSVNTINDGNPNGDTTPHHPELFRDNVYPNGPTINTEMDGLTTVLTCNATVNPGVTNHMKLAIADASDSALDSAVFIQAGSLISGTTISTSLTGGTQTGASISVPTGTAVTDQATLSGANAATAGGTVSYKVYSDNACQTQVADAGTVTVTSGSVPASSAITENTAGAYYWQASYSGDATNNASTSPCGSEVLTVTGPQNHPPVADNGSVTTPENTPVATPLVANDADSDPLTYSIVTGPAHGTLSGTAPNLTYTPANGYFGPDSFTWKANDGQADSNVATESITVTQVSTGCPTSAPALDKQVAADQKTPSSKLVSPALTTTHAGDLVLAFVEADGPQAPTQHVTAVSGGGLTWSLAARSNATWGTTEVWQAHATGVVNHAKITATLASAYDGSITVAAFSGAASQVGATATTSGISTAPSATMTPTACNSLVWAAGHDWLHNVNPVAASGQTFAHLFVDKRVHDSFWTQAVTAPTTTDPVTVADTLSKSDRWTLAAVEIPAALS